MYYIAVYPFCHSLQATPYSVHTYVFCSGKKTSYVQDSYLLVEGFGSEVLHFLPQILQEVICKCFSKAAQIKQQELHMAGFMRRQQQHIKSRTQFMVYSGGCIFIKITIFSEALATNINKH